MKLHTVAVLDEPDTHLAAVCEVAGAQFSGADITLLEPGDSVELHLEPENEHDPYAVAVYFASRRVGYVPANSGANINLLVRTLLLSSLSVTCIVRSVDEGATHVRSRVKLGVYVRCERG